MNQVGKAVEGDLVGCKLPTIFPTKTTKKLVGINKKSTVKY